MTAETTARPRRRRVRNIAVATAVMEMFGLIGCGFITLVLWWVPPKGPDNELVAASLVLPGLQPALDRLRQSASPHRRTAVALALLTWGAVALLTAGAVALAFPASADQHIDLITGLMLGMPAGAALLSRLLNRGSAT